MSNQITKTKEFIQLCKDGEYESVLQYMHNPKYRISYNYNYSQAFIESLKHNHRDIIELLLSLTGENEIILKPGYLEAEFIRCCLLNKLDTLELFLYAHSQLSDTEISLPTDEEANEIFIMLCSRGYSDIVTLILSLNPKFCTETFQKAFILACKHVNTDIVKLLYNTSTLTYKDINKGLFHACKYNNINLVRYLTSLNTKPCIDFSYYTNFYECKINLLKSLCDHHQDETIILKELLQLTGNNLIIPSFECLELAFNNNNINICEVLINLKGTQEICYSINDYEYIKTLLDVNKNKNFIKYLINKRKIPGILLKIYNYKQSYKNDRWSGINPIKKINYGRSTMVTFRHNRVLERRQYKLIEKNASTFKPNTVSSMNSTEHAPGFSLPISDWCNPSFYTYPIAPPAV